MSRGKSRQAGIPPMRCEARAKTTGRPCRAFAVVGTRRCKDHGAWSPQAAAKGQERATVAQLMQHEDPDRPRPWAEVLTEAVHNLDALQRTQRDVRLALLRGEAVTPEDLDRLLRFSQAAAHLVEVGVRTNVGVELVRQARLSVEMDGALVFRALAAAHDAQHRLLEERGVPQDLAEALLVAAHEAAGEELRRAEDPAYREDLRRASLRELEGGRPA